LHEIAADDPEEEARWHVNVSELNRIAAIPGLDREMHDTDAERIEAEQ
jgi:hypothetical protein